MSQRGRTTGRPRPAASQPGRRVFDPAHRARLRSVIEPVVASAGYDVEDLSVSRAGRRHVVRLIVDGDGGVSLDTIAELSRVVSGALDAAELASGELVPGEYVLEVSSPGVDRPLTQPRHWRRNVGRLVTAALADGGEVTGRIADADDAGVVLEIAGAARAMSYAELGPGRVQIEFTRADVIDDGDLTEVEDEQR